MLFRQDKCMHQQFSKFFTSLKIHDYENMHIRDVCDCLIDFTPFLKATVFEICATVQQYVSKCFI